MARQSNFPMSYEHATQRHTGKRYLNLVLAHVQPTIEQYVATWMRAISLQITRRKRCENRRNTILKIAGSFGRKKYGHVGAREKQACTVLLYPRNNIISMR
ncbi:hypothetical protein Bcep18194_A4834 [Burkholderia lata]|uniref:Uncharacterized protein n=1 Tax=Burkholderia lata (strain ATCC 17760 / DSM 23089 / LMG 22485 / NCIMB 9086 / R18194 / 383) TaxID=482957 RepID=Q39GI7_BURL3|nr:hypothetical protein Bcep18194_A4834 [Burkholderia lata]